MQKLKTSKATQKEKARNLLLALAQKDLKTTEHSIGVACMAETFSKYINHPEDKKTVFLAGLLHDIGKFNFKPHFFQNFTVSSSED